jgi:putative addiction module CopG family antidote
MSEQIAIRITEELAASVEQLVTSGRFRTKAEVVRAALDDLIERERRHEVGEKISQGYRRMPQDEDDVAAATEAAIRSIHEEPW